MRRIRWLMLTLLAGLALMAWLKGEPARDGAVAVGNAGSTPAVVHEQAPSPPLSMPPPASTPQSPASGDDALPREVDDTLALIATGGPFPFERDGLVFGNFEARLPKRARGWYHEYTVPTPGLDHRGARRIVTGGEPPSEFWYTDDHYESFRRVGE